MTQKRHFRKDRVNHIFRPSGSTVTLPAGGIIMPLAFTGSEIRVVKIVPKMAFFGLFGAVI